HRPFRPRHPVRAADRHVGARRGHRADPRPADARRLRGRAGQGADRAAPARASPFRASPFRATPARGGLLATLRERLVSAAFSAGWNLVCRLPESWARALFEFGADTAWRRQGPGVRVLEGNLVRVLRTRAGDSLTPSEFGAELRALSRAVMRS